MVMLRLSRTGIRNLASSDIVYSRGLQYYKSNRVVNAAFSKGNGQYKLTVRGSYNYSVIITENADGTFEYTCNCPAHVKEKGACKHVVAALLFLLKYQEKSLMDEPQSPEEKKAYQVLDYFANQEEPKTQGDIFHLEASIIVPSILRGAEGRAYVSLTAGAHRMYKIQSIRKFLMDYYKKENIVLGKEFKYIAGESEFDRESKELLDYLLEIYEIQEAIDKAFYSRLFSKSQMVLTKNMLQKLFIVLGRNSFLMELYGKSYEAVRFTEGNPQIRYDLDVFEDTILFDYHEKEPVIPLSENGDIIYHNGFIYLPEKRFIRNYVPFYNTLGGEKKPLVFRGENKQRFLEEVLPRLHETMDITIPEELKERYLSLPLTAKIYFDKYNNAIKAELRFQYGDYEFNCFEDPKTDTYIIIRDREAETNIMRLLEQMDFEAHSSFYLLKNDGSIFEFLSGGVEHLKSVCELFYSEDFKKISVHSGGKFQIGLRVNQEIDLLEMDLDYGNIPREELRSLFRSYQLKKKYFRLKDGSFVDLTDEPIKALADILDNLNIQPKILGTESIQLSKSSAFYLEDALKEQLFQVKKNEEFHQLIERILSPKQQNYPIPKSITAALRPYQITGYEWLCTLAENSLGGILADDMGLGKTLQSIVYIASRMKKNRKFMIVCPTSLAYNWLDEFETFAPEIRTVVIAGMPSERQELIEQSSDIPVLITSYPLIRRDIMHYQKLQFDTVFIDEAQFIKNAASLNAQSVKQLKANHRFALTGTPIENSLSELWSIFDFIMPNYLMSHTKFIKRYEKLILKDNPEALEELNRRIRPFVLRRMKIDVLKELPLKIEEKILTEMTEEQKKVYLSFMENIRTNLDLEHAPMEKNQIKILAALTRLRQICCHPSTFLNDYQGGSGKMELLFELLEEAIANQHRILVFSQFTSMLGLIAAELKRREISFFYLEGSTSIEDRSEYVRKFNAGQGDVFLISLKAGGTGLNLTGADMVIHYDPWWNPAVEEQATDRAYRIGQEKNVHVIKLLTRGTIEEKIYKLQKRKQELSDSVIQAKEVFINMLTKEELEDIFQ